MRYLPLMPALMALLLHGSAAASSGPAPADFAGAPFGATLDQVRARHHTLSRNPDSDAEFQVYMVSVLEAGAGAPRSPAAFNFYRGALVGGQVLLNTSTAGWWLEKMKAQYGAPDSCNYCESPDMATARWRWPNGSTVAIEGGGMLSIFTEQGDAVRKAWIARGESGEKPKVAAAQPPETAGKKGSAARHAAAPADVTWQSLWVSTKRQIKRWIPWR